MKLQQLTRSISQNRKHFLTAISAQLRRRALLRTRRGRSRDVGGPRAFRNRFAERTLDAVCDARLSVGDRRDSFV